MTTRFILLAVISVGLMTLDHRRHLDHPVREVLQTAAFPIHFTVNLPFDLAGYLSENLASRRALIEENSRLRDQHLLYETRLQRLDQLERENIRLQGLLESSYEVEDAVLIAELMRVDLDPYRHVIQLDKGTRHGVFIGQPVLDAHGVVGQVDTVGRNTSIVRLITDPSHGIPVQVNRNGLRTVAVGNGNLGELELPHLPHNADVRAGDLLVTSGLAGRFPRGYPVAEIIDVSREPGLPFARVVARPKAELDRSREMLLVRTSRDGRRGEAEEPSMPSPAPDPEAIGIPLPPGSTITPGTSVVPGGDNGTGDRNRTGDPTGNEGGEPRQ